MNYDMKAPCEDCPFLKKNAHAYTERRLLMFTKGEFPCHKTAEHVEQDEDDYGNVLREGGYTATATSSHCAGALIFMDKGGDYHQMARIAGRMGMFDPKAFKRVDEVRDPKYADELEAIFEEMREEENDDGCEREETE